MFSNSSRPGGAHAVTELVKHMPLEPGHGHGGARQTVSLSTADKYDVYNKYGRRTLDVYHHELNFVFVFLCLGDTWVRVGICV